MNQERSTTELLLWNMFVSTGNPMYYSLYVRARDGEDKENNLPRY